MKKYRILLIDDMPEVRRSIRSVFCPQPTAAELFQLALDGKKGEQEKIEHPYDITEASQGEEGVAMFSAAKLAGTPFDLIFVDMVMPPGIDGRETIRRIRGIDIEIPLIVFTSFHEFRDEHLLECNRGGRQPKIIYKPITDSKILIDAAHAEFAYTEGIA